ncbi:NTP transferase domain-containing protein [Antrihabitans sp. YC2-6]|uniref:NTP transferase domain-containing protein n=1 Tax=Antrihabitans sp. YC2-6 TaxID=2799498 RepID=UPI0018F65FC1|nr:NTP transferase domain-containing protein [Antrihabitans sp. YC2-6]MBJ8348796.1 NTP transferase domain-containing protein [Antrihabitans sp. YC2-6]
MVAMRIDAIVLAGGRASRMGGVDKPAISVGGRTLLQAALDATAECERTVVVGPHRAELPSKIIQTQEVPHGSGPVAAIGAALREIPGGAELVAVLAADMPFVRTEVVSTLADRCTTAAAAFAIDDAGRPQYLVGVWRKSFLVDRVAGLASLVNLSMKSLLPDDAETVRLEGVSDCDTEEDVRRATAAIASKPATDIDAARETVRQGVPLLPVRRVPLLDALGATLAEPVRAAAPLPRFDVSAMDGYAVAGDGPWQLRAEIGYAGGTRPSALQSGEAVRIATGAHVPDGSTSVLRDEFADAEYGRLSRKPEAPVRDDIRRAGEDWQPGFELVQAGSVVTPAVVSAAASGEVTAAEVRGPVRAHVVVTGDEIRRDGPLRSGQTRDSLGPVLNEFLSWCGIRSATQAHLRDTPNGFDDVLTRAVEAHLIVIVGATGRGAADQLRGALERAAATVLVERVRCRPGGSQVTAVLPDGRVVLGLPGNPFAAVSTLLTTTPAIVAGLVGKTPRPRTVGTLANADQVAGNTTRIVPARRREDGSWEGAASTRTAHLAGLVGQDALAIVPPDAVVNATVELVIFPN